MWKWCKKIQSWLIIVVLVLVIFSSATFPAVYSCTDSGKSDSPNLVLTYTPNKLTWNSTTVINNNGAVELNLFENEYSNVKSSNGENIVAPGTDKTSTVRLKNDIDGTIEYTAILYQIETDKNLQLNPVVTGGAFMPTDEYHLPEEISNEQVITAIKGSLKGKDIQDFHITWDWDFYIDEDSDTIDTMLGDKEKLDTIAAGLYIQVEDKNTYAHNHFIPQTGDKREYDIYLVLMLVSIFIVMTFYIEYKKNLNELR